MSDRSAPYPSYAYVVYLNRPGGLETLLGGFTATAGLSQRSFRYRTGNEFVGSRGGGNIFGGAGLMQGARTSGKVNDVTLKRGVVSAGDLWNWIAAVRGAGGAGKCDATVTLRNEAGAPVMTWKLSQAMPVRYTGPPLGGHGGDVAIEELVLCAELIEIVPPR